MGLFEKKSEMRTEDKLALKEICEEIEEKLQKDMRFAMRTRYAEYVEKLPIKKNHVLYEAYCGRGLICGPYAIFKYLLSQKRFKNFIHIWVLEDFAENQEIMREYASYPNVKFIEFESDEYLQYLATAQYLINNVSFRGYFVKRKGQIMVDTWHGIPLKLIGFEISDGNITAGNTGRNLLMADYLISPNSFMTDIYKKTFKVDGVFQGRILQVGQARSDRYYAISREEAIEKLRRAGVKVDSNKKVILYAPTWKGERYKNPDTGLDSYFELIKRVERSLGTEEYQILVKPHQIVYKFIKTQPNITKQFIPATVDTNELLSVVDVLISDYSSIYFDFLVSKRPILFFVPDLQEYTTSRGLYFGIDKLPGPIAESFDELEDMLKDIDRAMEPHWAKYYEEQVWACAKDDGNVCKRIADVVFRKRYSKDSIKCNKTSKKKVLFYAGPLNTNGITYSFLTLLSHIDYEKYDVTVLAHGAANPEVAERLNKMPKNVRVLYRSMPYGATRQEQEQHQLLMMRGLDAGIPVPVSFYEREMRRLVGACRFDYVIEFTGYSRLYALLFAQMKHTKKMIWMHNELQREPGRITNGGVDAGELLQVCVSTYPYMDKIVGCSKTVMELNKKSLATEKTENKFVYARNLVNDERIFEEEKVQTSVDILDREYYVLQKDDRNSHTPVVRVIETPQKGKINFVTMGRLSPEKNQENLVLAFSRMYKENPDVRLYIIGEGYLRGYLEKLIEKEELENVVYLVGNTTHPFNLMRLCQCFILPSEYEGQPLVIQEARTIGLPIIVAEFASVQDVLIENGQLLVKQDVQSLYEGMRAFLDGKVPNYHFSSKEYNAEVYQEFERLLDR